VASAENRQFVGIERFIHRRGGLVRASDLEAAGYPRSFVQIFVNGRRVIRVCKGWYALPDVDERVLRARRVGGRLACVSALAFHGVLEPSEPALHLAVPSNASRLRLKFAGPVVVHWSRRRLAGDLHAVSVEEAAKQAKSCQGAVAATL